MRYRRLFTALCVALTGWLLIAQAGCGGPPAAAPAAAMPLREQMRLLWSPPVEPPITEWLVCGPFAQLPAETMPASQPMGETDFLAGCGGEAAARPTAGQTVLRPDGSAATWTAYTSPTESVEFAEALGTAPLGPSAAYAYATVTRAESGPTFLFVRARCDVKVYCNGRPVPGTDMVRHREKAGCLLPVLLRQGPNHLLVRADAFGGHWAFELRIADDARRQVDGAWAPMPMVRPAGADSGKLRLCTDVNKGLPPEPVRVEVLGPAGEEMAAIPAVRGEEVELDVSTWPEGPYDIRIVTRSWDGYPLTTYLPWFKGDWVAEACSILDACGRLPADSTDPSVLRQRFDGELILARLGGDPRELSGSARAALTNDAAMLRQTFGALMEFRELAQGDGDSGAGGFCRLVWIDEVDGSPQFARLYFPPSYDPDRAYPLVVFLHGSSPSNPPLTKWGDQCARHHPLADRYDVLYLEPHGRGNSGYRGIGEADVMRAVALVKRRYRVDDDRVYLIGRSTGGSGAWWVGSRHPDVFAAVATIFGGWDYHLDKTDEEVARMAPLRRALLEQESSFAHAENLFHTPVFVQHGDEDEFVSVEHSRYAVRMLQRWGYDVRYREHPGRGHELLGNDNEIVAWLLTQRLQPHPRLVRIRAPSLGGGDVHWLHLQQQEDPFSFMNAQACVTTANTILLDTDNVLEVRLTPGAELIDPLQRVRVVWNGRTVHLGAMPPSGELTLRAEGYAPGPLVKRPRRPTPFAIVIGTASSDPRMQRLVARAGRRAQEAWKQWQHVQPRCFSDTRITDEQMRAYSLELIGGPDENLVTRRLIGDIPLKIAPDGVTVDGRTFPVRDAAVRLTYPHPLNSHRYVTIRAGNSAAGFFLTDHLPDDLDVDFLIDDGRVSEDFDRTTVVWGRFDHNWRFQEKYAHFGDPSARARAPVRRTPTRLTTVTDQPRLMLSEVLETETTGSYVMMRRDMSRHDKPMTMGGRTFASGIAVGIDRRPCKVVYDLAGGDWRRLRATVGIELEKKPAELTAAEKRSVMVFFIARGDGKELYRSPGVQWDSHPIDIDVEIAGVTTLELVTLARHSDVVASINWGNLRLEKPPSSSAPGR